MNGRKAKQLRREAFEETKNFPREDSDYRVLMNHIEWVPALTKEGKLMFDKQGTPLLKPQKSEGTRLHNQPFMLMYKALKRTYYQTRQMSLEPLEKNRKNLYARLKLKLKKKREQRTLAG